MKSRPFRTIDPVATGANIIRLRKERGLSVRDLQAYFGFEEPRAIYKWQCGQSLPSVDNLYALGALLEVSMEEILVQTQPELNIRSCEQQAEAVCCSPFYQNRLAVTALLLAVAGIMIRQKSAVVMELLVPCLRIKKRRHIPVRLLNRYFVFRIPITEKKVRLEPTTSG